jgi:hypothetical protein
MLAGGLMRTGILCHRPTAGPTTRIDDLTIPAAEILALSPVAAKVDVLVAAIRPTHRIIQIADWHYFPREDFTASGREPSEEGYCEYVRHVDELQETQLRLLHWLVDNRGLSMVFQEGLWEEALPEVDHNLESLREWCASRAEVEAFAAQLHNDIDDAEAHGLDATALRTRQRAAEEYAQWGLYCGAVRRLLISRQQVRLLPAEG